MVRLMKPSRVMVTTIWPGSIRLSSSWSASASAMSVIRGEAISLRAAASSSRHHFHAADARAEDVQQFADLSRDLGQLGLDFLALQAGQACRRSSRMPRACSSVRRTVPSGAMTLPGSSISASSAPISSAGQSRSISADAGGGGVGAGADQPDDLVDIGDRDREADQLMRPVARLAEVEARRGGG